MAKLFSGIKVNKHSAEECPESYMGPEVLEWDEIEMYGLKFPGGTIKVHSDDIGLEMYVIHDITLDQIKACIQDMKDLGFTEDAEEGENYYMGSYSENKNITLSIEYSYYEEIGYEAIITLTTI